MNFKRNQPKAYRRAGINALSRGASVNEAIRAQIKQYILDQGLQAGDPLPPETQWAQELGVNRSSVREAVKALESLGLIEIRHGQGLFVRERNFDHLLETMSFDMQFDPASPTELAQIRAWLEMAAFPDAFQAIGPAEIETLDGILQEWRGGFRAEGRSHVLSSGSSIDVLWGMYDEMALGGLTAIKERGLTGKITVMGYDNTPDAYAAIKRGEMHVTVDTAPKEMGYNLVYAIKKYVIDGEMVPKAVRSEIALWDRSNINRFDTDNYYHAPMKPRPPVEVTQAHRDGLAPAWVTIDGQIMSLGQDIVFERSGFEPPPTRKSPPIRVGFIPTAQNTHYEIVIAGARTAIDELGGPAVVDMVVHFPPHQTAIAEQMTIVERCIDQNYDALAICTADDEAMMPLYEKAAQRGIPIFLFNMPMVPTLNPYYVSNVGYDQREAGRLIGLWLVQHFGAQPTNVAVLEGLPGLHNAERLGGFKEGIASHQNIRIVASQSADWVRDKGRLVIDRVFQLQQDKQFHYALYAPLGNQTLLRLLDTFWTAFGDFLIDSARDPELDLADHVAILDAIKARDLNGAQQALRHNLLSMQDSVRTASR